MRCVPSIRRIAAPARFWPEIGLFDSLLDDFVSGAPINRRMVPAVDIKEKDGKLFLHAELPGLSEKEIGLKLEGKILTLSGERKFEDEDSRDSYTRIERSYGSFSRSFTLPDTADLSQIKADYKNGILTVTIPLKPESQPREVPIAIQ